MVDRLIEAWASSPILPGDVEDPGSALENVGIQNGQILGHDEFNYLLRQFSRCPVVFDKLEEAAEVVTTGRVAIVNEYDPATQPGAQKWAYSNASVSQATDIATDGRFVYLVFGNTVVALDRTSGAALATLSLTGAMKVYSDGGRVFVAYNESGAVWKVRAYDLPNPTWGSPLWTSNDLGAAINDVYSDGDAVFVAQNQATSVSARRLNRATGAFTWSSTAHNATLLCIVSDGEDIYAGGAPDGAVTVRRLDRTAGTSVATANAPATDVDGIALIGSRDGGEHATFRRPHIVVVGNDATDDVIAYDDGLTSVWSKSVAAGVGECNGVCYDGRSVWVVSTIGPANPHLEELDVWHGNKLRRVDWDVPTVNAIASDGFGLFVAGDKPAATDQIAWRRHLLRFPGLVVRLAGNERWRWPWHIGILPAEHGPAGPAFTD